MVISGYYSTSTPIGLHATLALDFINPERLSIEPMMRWLRRTLNLIDSVVNSLATTFLQDLPFIP